MVCNGDRHLNGAVTQRDRIVVAGGIAASDRVVQREILRDVDAAVRFDRNSECNLAAGISIVMSRIDAAHAANDQAGRRVLIEIDVMAVGGLNARPCAVRHLQRIDQRLRRKIRADVEARRHNDWQRAVRIRDRRRVCR